MRVGASFPSGTIESMASVRALASPRRVVLPAVGARLQRSPRLTSLVLRVLRALPGGHLRNVVLRNVLLPLVQRMRVALVVPVAGGSQLLVSMADIEGKMLATSGIWEPQTLALMTATLVSGDIFVDLGANLGFFSLFATGRVGPTGRVYAVEPAPETYGLLLENVRRNGVSNIITKEVAAGAAPGEAVLYDVRGEILRGAASIKRRAGEVPAESQWSPTPVRVEPLTDIVEASDLPRLRLIKIDVEGAEADVLAGLESLYVGSSPRPTLAIEVHTAIVPEAPSVIAEFCRRHRLRAFRIGDAITADRRESATRLNVASISPDELAATRDDYFYVVLTDEPLTESTRLETLAEEARRAATT